CASSRKSRRSTRPTKPRLCRCFLTGCLKFVAAGLVTGEDFCEAKIQFRKERRTSNCFRSCSRKFSSGSSGRAALHGCLPAESERLEHCFGGRECITGTNPLRCRGFAFSRSFARRNRSCSESI